MAVLFHLLISSCAIRVLTLAVYVLIHSTSCVHQVTGRGRHTYCTVGMHEGGLLITREAQDRSGVGRRQREGITCGLQMSTCVVMKPDTDECWECFLEEMYLPGLSVCVYMIYFWSYNSGCEVPLYFVTNEALIFWTSNNSFTCWNFKVRSFVNTKYLCVVFKWLRPPGLNGRKIW